MFALKALVLAVAFIATIPISRWLRRDPRAALRAWVLIGVLPFIYTGIGVNQPMFITLLGGTQWPGYLKGAEFSVIDVLTIAIYFSLPRSKRSVPFRASMLLYFIAVLFSVFQTDVPSTAFYYLWQLARVFFVYVVVAKASARDERIPLAIMTGMTIGLCLQTGIALYQKFFLGELRAGGMLGAQNNLGMMTHFVIFPLFALYLAGQRGWPMVAGPLAGIVSSILTVSRAAIGINGIGFVLVFFLSALQRWTTRKAVVGLIGAILTIMAAPMVISSIEHRYATEDAKQSTDTRAAFIRAATMMISDHPFGVGASNYVRAANIGGYNARAELPFPEWAIDVHNAFYLATAETGYLGLLTLVIMLTNVMVTAFRAGWQNRTNHKGALLLGLGVTLLTVYAHSWFEFILFFAGTQYAFAIAAGLIAGLATQLGYWRGESARRLGANSGRHPVSQLSEG